MWTRKAQSVTNLRLVLVSGGGKIISNLSRYQKFRVFVLKEELVRNTCASDMSEKVWGPDSNLSLLTVEGVEDWIIQSSKEGARTKGHTRTHKCLLLWVGART